MAPIFPNSYVRETEKSRTRTRRSRYGCRNCKLRKLKASFPGRKLGLCDEAKPQCRKCTSFGVICNYMANLPDLEPVVPSIGTTSCGVATGLPVSTPVWTSDVSGTYRFHLDARLQKLISRYFGENMIGAYEPKMAGVNQKLMELAFSYPFLMHALIAGALTYDRYMDMISNPQRWSSNRGTPRRTLQECYHLSQSTILLNKHLQDLLSDRPASESTIPDRDINRTRDPMLGAGALLSILTFSSSSSSSNASSPQESWPLAVEDDNPPEFNWSRMSNSKMCLWNFVDPLRKDSIFSVLAPTYADMCYPLPESGTDGIPPDLACLCKLTPTSNADTSPYFLAAHAVGHIWGDGPILGADKGDKDGEKVKVGSTQVFTRVVSGPFEELLKARDPVALLLLYLWYCKARRGIWWIELRARVEVPAIHEYLRRYHGANAEVMRFLLYRSINCSS
ncbi:hypothetical protein V8F33_010047 [Rhypophila sp. PSN 637]